ncbi:PEP-CTERM sorting domain-containing protein [Kiritimatiellota bacterium B12222]|nr:PEP-CTERM sorting domain-containing protein [Kiritimatiellota bacterium B12222]
MKSKVVLFLFTSAMFMTALQADIITWTGLDIDDNNWSSPDNWSGSYAPPRNTDYQDTAQFNLLAPQTVTIDGVPKVKGLDFANAGWTLNGNFNQFKELSSTGVGTNTINGNLGQARGDATWNVVGVDHTLRVIGNINYYDQKITLTGGGTLWVDDLTVSGSASFSPSFTLQGATLKLEDTLPHTNSGSVGNAAIKINVDGLLVLKTSNVSSVEALFGSEILNDTGLGSLQAVYNSGSGYTTVSVIPESSTATLLLISGLSMFCVLRKRKS